MRWIVIALWLWFAALGALLVQSRQAQDAACDILARRHLPSGFRLGDGDWSGPGGVPSVSGKYTDREYPGGTRICATDLRDAPVLAPNAGFKPVVLSTRAGPLNAGARVDLWKGGKAIAEDVRVLAILCPNNECSTVVVELPDDLVQSVAQDPEPPVVIIRALP